MQPQPLPDAAAQQALEGLADIVVPAPVSWMPQTVGWAVLAAALAVAVLVGLWRWRQHALRNRYRAEALAELRRIEALAGDPSRRAVALGLVAVLMKRTALAAYPRTDVARLSGSEWVDFLRHRGPCVSQEAVTLLDDLEYCNKHHLAEMTDSEVGAIVTAARSWIRGHRVPA